MSNTTNVYINPNLHPAERAFMESLLDIFVDHDDPEYVVKVNGKIHEFNDVDDAGRPGKENP